MSAQAPTPALLQKLSAPAMAHWREAPARAALERFAAETGVPLWIDRRVDTRREVSITVRNRPVAELLDAIASATGLGVAAVDEIVYVGPADAAASIDRLTKAWRRSAPSALRRETTLEWRRLAEPREVIDRVAAGAGLTIENAEAVPHDLWPAAAMPPLAVGDQLTLLCLGFDLQWKIADRKRRVLRLEPLDAKQTSTPPSLASLVGDVEFLPGEPRYSLRIQDLPVRPVLEQLAAQLGRELVVDTEVGALDRRMSFEVRQATVEELLDAAGKAAGLEISANETAVLVRLPH